MTSARATEAASGLGGEANTTSASVWNRKLKLEATLEPGTSALSLKVYARQTDTWVAVLGRREATRLESGALLASLPSSARFEVTRTEHGVGLSVRGTAPGGLLSLVGWLGEEDEWLSITETLHLHEKEAPPVAEFSATWQLENWNEPGEVFSPHLVPEPRDIVGVHCLRSPVLTAEDRAVSTALISDVDGLAKQREVPGFLCLLRRDGKPLFQTGLVSQKVRGHVFFEATREPVKARELHHSYLVFAALEQPKGTALRVARQEVWKRFGARAQKAATVPRASGAELAKDLFDAVMAKKWREGRIGGARVGAITTDRTFPGDVWMCPWFHNLSTGYGLFIWGERLRNEDFVARARAVLELHLAAPVERGLFPTLYVFDEGGAEGAWFGSHTQGGGLDVLHLQDMSYTLYWLVLFEREGFGDPRILERVKSYVNALGELMRPDGGLPAYVSQKTRKPVSEIDVEAWRKAIQERSGGDWYVSLMLDKWGSKRFIESAEDSASLMFLAEALKLPNLDAETRKLALALANRQADWLIEHAVEPASYIDFEVYWSCAPNPLDLYDARSGQHPQNLLSVYMAAEGLLALYEATRDEKHLAAAKRVMDRLSLYQQVWDPPFLSFDGFGGYAAQNTDGEWSDARQALFVITHMNFHRVTGEVEHLERAKAACRASFSTVFHPALAALYPVGWAREPLGFAAENHAHSGHDHMCGVSSFHWGSGSALMAAAYLEKRGIAPW